MSDIDLILAIESLRNETDLETFINKYINIHQTYLKTLESDEELATKLDNVFDEVYDRLLKN